MSAQTQGWESIWAEFDTLPEYWRTPERAVIAWAEQLWKAGGRRVLDLGCGVGRHTIALARMGFAVTAADISPSGLGTCVAGLSRAGLSAAVVRHEMEVLPFATSVFDGVIAYNVIYHTTAVGMRRILAAVHRVLSPGGWLYATAIARADSRIAGFRADIALGGCREIEPFTFVYLRDAPGDKHLPHHYCDEAELRAFLADFVVDGLRLVRVEYVDEGDVVQVGAHYHVQARRP
ncbi:MAG: methyltransferase domain-containing protein [Anaerolineae bacterium]|nr:methyltransferase domain-containing protein [Anaerolineae bacterium]